LNESTEKTRYIQKALELARSSGQYIERLWRVKIDVSRFGDFIAPIFSSIFDTLVNAVTQVASYSGTIRELSLNRIMFLPPFDFLFRTATTSEEEFAPIEMGKANVSFLFTVTAARKTARTLTKRIATRTPKSALTLAPLFEAEVIEETVEEPAKTVPNLVADFQSSFESKLAPSTKSMMSALQKSSRQTFLPLSLLAMSTPVITGSSRFEGLPYQPSVALPEKEAPQLSLSERPLAASPSVTSYPHKEIKAEFLPLVSVSVVKFGAEATRSVGYAAGLPNILLQREISILKLPVSPAVSAPIVESPVSMPIEGLRPDVVDALESVAKLPSFVFDQNIPILNSLALSLVSTPKKSLPSIKPASRYTKSATFEEISPHLTSWVYNVSEILRDTTLSLSAVPSVASTVGKIVTEFLLQPMSSVEAPLFLTIHEVDLAPSRPETGGKSIAVEAFKLPQIVASLVVGLGQKYPLLSGGAEIRKTLTSTVELTGVIPEETLPLGTVPEVETFSKLSTVIALASTESLIAQRLQEDYNILIKGIHVARSSSGETLSALGAFSPTRTTMVSRMAAASTFLSSRAKSSHWGPSVPQRPSKLSPAKSTVQNTFNITIAESTDEDLRDLERKISRILSEQIRRYYGSSRI
jgi:hypothetical protein